LLLYQWNLEYSFYPFGRSRNGSAIHISGTYTRQAYKQKQALPSENTEKAKDFLKGKTRIYIIKLMNFLKCVFSFFFKGFSVSRLEAPTFGCDSTAFLRFIWDEIF